MKIWEENFSAKTNMPGPSLGLSTLDCELARALSAPLTPLQCALTQNAPATLLECALTRRLGSKSFGFCTYIKIGGWGVQLEPSAKEFDSRGPLRKNRRTGDRHSACTLDRTRI